MQKIFAFIACLCLNFSIEQTALSQDLGIPENGKFSKEEAADICSIFGVPVINAKAISSGDVLFRVDSFFDSTISRQELDTGITQSGKTLVRVVFDHPNKRYFIARLNTTKTTVYASGKIVSENDDGKLHAACAEANSISIRSGGKLRKFPRANFGKDEVRFLGFMNFFDIRSFSGGESGIPLTFKDNCWGNNHESRSGVGLHQYFNKEDGSLEIWSRGDLTELGRIFHITVFDAENSMPISAREIMCDEKNNQKARGPERSISWVELDGLFVPDKSNSRKRKSRDFGGREESGRLTKEFRFHWLALNDKQKLDDRFFDGSFVASENQILALVDPKANGAKKLLDEK